MTELKVGVVDVFVLRGADRELEVLVMRRAAGVRCTGAWETVHGRIEAGESPEDAALREVAEETGLRVERLYNVICQAFYLHRQGTVQVAVAFGAFVGRVEDVRLSAEHDALEWLTPEAAVERLSWPRSRTALRDAVALLRSGDAGPVDDVLRVR
jgi:8-oxo-dGTP pyrophosphatase MutT (NUDIX family)